MNFNESKDNEKKFKMRKFVDEISVCYDIAGPVINALSKRYELEIEDICTKFGQGPIRVIIRIYEVLGN